MDTFWKDLVAKSQATSDSLAKTLSVFDRVPDPAPKQVLDLIMKAFDTGNVAVQKRAFMDLSNAVDALARRTDPSLIPSSVLQKVAEIYTTAARVAQSAVQVDEATYILSERFDQLAQISTTLINKAAKVEQRAAEVEAAARQVAADKEDLRKFRRDLIDAARNAARAEVRSSSRERA